MENKEVIVDKLLCMACLCIGRELHKVTDHKMQNFFLKILHEIPLCNISQVCPSICWECSLTLRKAFTFTEQVKDSYRILQTYTSENLYECLLTDITRPSRFNINHLEAVSIPPNEDPDLGELAQGLVEVELKKLEAQVDVQVVAVKEESVEWEKDLNDSQCDDRSPSVCSDTIANLEEDIKKNIKKVEKKKHKKTAKEKVKTKKEKNKKISKKLKTVTVSAKKPIKDKSKKLIEKGQKIRTIELSYEEMLLEREKESQREGYLKSSYKCETCLLGFNYAKSYEAHKKTKHSPDLGEYSCPICSTVMASMESFTTHYKRHLRRYECATCGKRATDAKVMYQHYYSAHEVALKQYKCNLCGNISNSIDSHRYHRDSHKSRVQCADCPKTFSHRAGLMNHRLAVHEKHNQFVCAVCARLFRWQTSLKRHHLRHHSKDGQSSPAAFCSPCDIGFSSVSSYQRHLRNSLKHVSQDQLRFICDHCSSRFADKTKLRDHIEEKHLHRTFTCPICAKTSKNRVGLDQHIRNVHKGRPNNKMCHHCGKGFPTKVQLESHIRTHTGERPFICEFCPTTFSQQSNLYKHNRQVHLNIKSKKYPPTKKPRDNPEATTENQEYQKSWLQLQFTAE